MVNVKGYGKLVCWVSVFGHGRADVWVWWLGECLESCHWVVKIQAGEQEAAAGNVNGNMLVKGGRRYEADVERKTIDPPFSLNSSPPLTSLAGP